MNIICQSLYILSIHFRQISFLKSPKTFRVIITTILFCPCYMPKYVPRLEGIMHDPKVSRSCSTCVIRCVTIKRHKHQSNSYRFRSHWYTDCIADLVIPKGSHIYIYLPFLKQFSLLWFKCSYHTPFPSLKM